jgi:hypothetical protein
VIFTLPEPLAQLSLQNKREMYDLLFRATAETLQTIATDPQHLGAQIGFFCILHSWGQTHLHCLVPAGGIALDQTRWMGCRHPQFFLPEKALGAQFRGKFRALLRRRVSSRQATTQRNAGVASGAQSFRSIYLVAQK